VFIADVTQQDPRGEQVTQDVELARRCHREVDAREQLYRQHAPKLYRLCYRLTGTPAEAEDLLQDVFIEILTSLPNYRGEAPLAAWMRRIAVRTAMHGHRKRRRRAQLALVDEAGRTSADIGSTVDSRVALRRVRELLGKLGDTTRIAFLLFQVDGYSIAETAALLGLSETAAKKRIWRARKQLEGHARRDSVLSSFLQLGEREPGETR
jgi:RNA polymerase sigma-70 factor (ECF subfamily)